MEAERFELLLAVIAEELYLARIDREATALDDVDINMRNAKIDEITELRRKRRWSRVFMPNSAPA